MPLSGALGGRAQALGYDPEDVRYVGRLFWLVAGTGFARSGLKTVHWTVFPGFARTTAHPSGCEPEDVRYVRSWFGWLRGQDLNL
jgi:hypothetical protein